MGQAGLPHRHRLRSAGAGDRVSHRRGAHRAVRRRNFARTAGDPRARGRSGPSGLRLRAGQRYRDRDAPLVERTLAIAAPQIPSAKPVPPSTRGTKPRRGRGIGAGLLGKIPAPCLAQPHASRGAPGSARLRELRLAPSRSWEKSAHPHLRREQSHALFANGHHRGRRLAGRAPR